MEKPGRITVFESADETARAAANLFMAEAQAAVSARGVCSVALSGGSTPKRMYEILAETVDALDPKPEWLDSVHYFFGDERHVPPDDPDSNFRSAQEGLFARIGTEPLCIHRIPCERPPDEAAKVYQADLRTFFDAQPVFDLVFLGMGPDGHTASLFPNTSALAEKEAWVVANRVEQLDTWRVTLTYPVINRARRLVFLVGGENKRDALRRVLAGDALPAAGVRPMEGTLDWYLDRAAYSDEGL